MAWVTQRAKKSLHECAYDSVSELGGRSIITMAALLTECQVLNPGDALRRRGDGFRPHKVQLERRTRASLREAWQPLPPSRIRVQEDIMPPSEPGLSKSMLC